MIYHLLIICLLLSGCSELPIHDDADWSFIAMGDVRSGYGTYEKLLNIVHEIRPKPQFIVITGDLINIPGNVFEWHEFLKITRTIADHLIVFTVVGNHDVINLETQEIYTRYVRMPGNGCYYSFNHLFFHYIVLDTEVPGETNGIFNDQYLWLQTELEASQGDPGVGAIVIFLHRPLYAFGKNHTWARLINADQLRSLFESYSKVRLVIASHDHEFYYYPINGIMYLVSGGGGAPLPGSSSGMYYHFLKVGYYGAVNRINIKTYNALGEKIENIDL